VDEEIESFLDALGFDHAATATLGPDIGREGQVDGWTASGTAYRIDAEGPVTEIEGIADADRLGLNGSLFSLNETPHE
jgi:hypothetical protein